MCLILTLPIRTCLVCRTTTAIKGIVKKAKAAVPAGGSRDSPKRGVGSDTTAAAAATSTTALSASSGGTQHPKSSSSAEAVVGTAAGGPGRQQTVPNPQTKGFNLLELVAQSKALVKKRKQLLSKTANPSLPMTTKPFSFNSTINSAASRPPAGGMGLGGLQNLLKKM